MSLLPVTTKYILFQKQDFAWHFDTCEKNILKNSVNLSLASSLLRKYRQIHLLPRLYFHYFIMKMRQNCILFIWIADEFHLQKENPHFLKPYELFLNWIPDFLFSLTNFYFFPIVLASFLITSSCTFLSLVLHHLFFLL